MICALVSQSRGLAVFDDGDGQGVLLEERAEPLWPGAPELVRLLRGANDVETLTVASMSELRTELRRRRQREDALHAALLVIDGESSLALRRRAAQTWVRALGIRRPVQPLEPVAWRQASEAREPVGTYTPGPRSREIERWVEGVLVSVPVPPQADLAGAQAMVPGEGGEVFGRVEQHQPRIRAVHAAFLATCRKLGVGRGAALRARAVREGWFAALVFGEAAASARLRSAPHEELEFITSWVALVDP